MSTSNTTGSERVRVKRIPNRGHYDRDVIDPILDEAIICHVGFVVDGQPYVIPTGFARVGDSIYIHGSAASRMLRKLSDGVEVCVTVTILDGLVLARSAFNHSMNYRSVVVLGRAKLVSDDEEKMEALTALTDHFIPGRWQDVRPPTELEMKATSVLKLDITEASAKIRTGPPIDDDEDYDLPYWAGVIPLSQTAGEPIADERLSSAVAIPDNVASYGQRS